VIGTGGGGFAIDHFLTAYAQCDYTATARTGVCPDPSGSCTTNVALVSSSRTGNVARVRFTRPLAAADSCDHAYSTTAPTRYAL